MLTDTQMHPFSSGDTYPVWEGQAFVISISGSKGHPGSSGGGTCATGKKFVFTKAGTVTEEADACLIQNASYVQVTLSADQYKTTLNLGDTVLVVGSARGVAEVGALTPAGEVHPEGGATG